jgi:hypothetical protein
VTTVEEKITTGDRDEAIGGGKHERE